MQDNKKKPDGVPNKRLQNTRLFKLYQQQNRRQMLRKRFGAKSWCEMNRKWKWGAAIFSYFFQVCSITAAFYGAYKLFSLIGAPAPAAVLLSIILLVLIEWAKRESSDHVWDYRVSRGRFDWTYVSLSLFLFVASTAISGFGIHQGTKDFAPEASLIENDTTLSRLNEQLATLNRASEKASNNRNGRDEIYWPSQRAITKFAEGQNLAIAAIISRTENIDGENEKRLKQHRLTVGQAAMVALVVCILLEVLFEVCMMFRSLYDFRDYLESEGVTPALFRNKDFRDSPQFQHLINNLPQNEEVGFHAIKNRYGTTGTDEPETVGTVTEERLQEALTETLGTPVITTFQDVPAAGTKVIVSTETVPDVDRAVGGQIRRIQRYVSKLKQGIGTAGTAHKNIKDALETIERIMENGAPSKKKLEQVEGYKKEFAHLFTDKGL